MIMKEIGMFFVKLILTACRIGAMIIAGLIAGLIAGPVGSNCVKRWFEDQFPDLMWD